MGSSPECPICYKKFVQDDCQCWKCIAYKNCDKPRINSKLTKHCKLKYKYCFTCNQCNNTICRWCFDKITFKSNILICPLCRYPAIKEYFKSNIVPDINSLVLSKDKKLYKLKKYRDTWVKGYWEETGFPILNKILKK